MKTNTQFIPTTLFTIALMASGSLTAQQPEPAPAKPPFQLTHYDKRIPADSWMLFSADLDVFFKSKELMKATYGNMPAEDAPPKMVVDLLTSGKLKITLPYPLIFGLGGDPDQPNNSPDKSPAVMEFLKQRHQFGLYLNLSQVPDEVVTSIYRQEAANGNINLTEAQVLELFQGIKQMLPPTHFGMNFKKGEFNIVGATHDKNLANKWPGNGLPKTLLDAVPSSSVMVLGASLNIEEANEDLQARLGQILKVANLVQKIEAPNGQPPLDLEQIGAQLNAITRQSVGVDAKDLLKIFQGDTVMAMGMNPANNAGVGAPEPQFVIGATVKDEEKLTNLLDALEDNGVLPDATAKIVRRPGHLFICTPDLAPQLNNGGLAKPIAGAARKALQDNHLSMFLDMKKIMNLQAQTGQDPFGFGQDDPEMTAVFNQIDSLILAGQFNEGKMNQKYAFKFRDPNLDTLGLFAKVGAAQEERAVPPLRKPDQANLIPDDPHAALKAKAQSGNTDAMYTLGLGLWQGKNMGKDEVKGAAWLNKAANANNLQAQYMMGVVYWTGRGTKKDMATSYYWMSLAANGGHQEAVNWKLKAAEQITAEQRATVDKTIADKLKRN